MKMLLVMSSLVLGFAANAGTQIIYGLGQDTIVKDVIHFHGKGHVAANQVCVSADGQTLKADVPAREYKQCLDSYVDRSDSTHPKTVCTKSNLVQLPAETWTTPVSFSHHGCTDWSVDRSDSTHPVRKCLKTGEVRVTLGLTYEVYNYRTGDYRHESPWYSWANIPACK